MEKLYRGIETEDFLETGTSYLDTEGFVDYARSVSDVSVGVLLEERKTTTKGSLRAKRKNTSGLNRSLNSGEAGAAPAAMSSPLSLEELKKRIDRILTLAS